MGLPAYLVSTTMEVKNGRNTILKGRKYKNGNHYYLLKTIDGKTVKFTIEDLMTIFDKPEMKPLEDKKSSCGARAAYIVDKE